MSDEQARRLLRAHGFRSTRGRLDLLTVLRAARGPLAPAQILQRLRGRKLDRVSVYRALDALVDAGIVHRAYAGERTWTFETADRCEATRCHPHFTCRECGKVTCMTQTVPPLVRRLPHGYVIQQQRVHIEGICANCSQQARNSRRGSGKKRRSNTIRRPRRHDRLVTGRENGS